MSGHDLILAEMVQQANLADQERKLRYRTLLREAKAAELDRRDKPVRSGGIAALFRTLRNAVVHRPMTEVHG